MKVELSNDELAIIASGIHLMLSACRYTNTHEYIEQICVLEEKIMDIRCNHSPYPDAREGV